MGATPIDLTIEQPTKFELVTVDTGSPVFNKLKREESVQAASEGRV